MLPCSVESVGFSFRVGGRSIEDSGFWAVGMEDLATLVRVCYRGRQR